MTEDKARKRAIRTRMAKTGERYTAARRHSVRLNEQLHAEDLPQPDASLRQQTGKGWREWFRLLDAWGATERTHGEVAAHLTGTHDVPGWWAQTITVGYERSRGRRAKYQSLRGDFQVTVSKTFPVGVTQVVLAFIDNDRRRRWLEPGTMKLRSSRPGKSCRYDFRDGSRVAAFFVSKGRGKSTVAIQHERLPDKTAVEEMRAFWKERLSRLAEIVS